MSPGQGGAAVYDGKRVLAIVPARGRNDGVEHMNVRELGGRPLIDYTLALLRGCDFVDRIFVSTESDEIAEHARQMGFDVPFLRDPHLADVEITMEDVVTEAIGHFSDYGESYELVLNLYPNAPFKREHTLRAALDRVMTCDFVVPLYAHRDYLWAVSGDVATLAMDGARGGREDASVKYEERGGVYAYNLTRENWALAEKRQVGFVELGFHESRMVNSVYDLLLLERLAKLPQPLIEELMRAE